MATVFVLTAFSLNGEPMGEPKRLTALPIRIGRNGLNDFVLTHGGVSSFHARIEDVDGRLCVTDLGSKNGVLLVRGGPASSLAAQSALRPAAVRVSSFSWAFTAGCKSRSTSSASRWSTAVR